MKLLRYIQTFKDDKTPLGELAIWIKKMIHSQNKEAKQKTFCLIFIKCPI